MPTILGQTANVVHPMVRRYVHVRSSWSGNWQFVPYFEPIAATLISSPDVSEADFRYEFSPEILREGQTAFASYSPLNIRDYYVRISIQNVYGGPFSNPIQPIWHGQFADDQILLTSTVAEGTQQLKAYGLEHLLDRVEIDRAFFIDNSSSGGGVKEMSTVPTFNRRSTRSYGLDGNRKKDEVGNSYVFDTLDTEKWSNKNIVDYLLDRIVPDSTISWSLSGPSDVLGTLDNTFELWDFRGATILQAINRLIDRRRGVGWNLVVDQDEARVNVWSVTSTPFRFGSVELPANQNQVFFEVGASHLIGEIPFRTSSTAQYDEIEVVGEPVKATGTFHVKRTELEKAWTDELQTEYIDATDGVDDEEKDRLRSTDRFRSVFAHFRVPDSWDGKLASKALLVKEQSDGTIDVNSVGPFWRQDKRFERETTLTTGINYTKEQRTDENPTKAFPEFLPVLAYAKLPEKDVYELVDRINEATEFIPNGHVRPLDNDLGLEVAFGPRHVIGKPEADDIESRVEPELEWNELRMTATIVLDSRPRITLEGLSGSVNEIPRKLLVEVPSAETWYVIDGTVYDIDEKGKEVKYTSPSGTKFERDDRIKLHSVAASLAAWYGPRRQAVTIPIKQLGQFVPIGSILTQIVGAFGREPVQTPITDIAWDFVSGVTRIGTNWTDIDAEATIPEGLSADIPRRRQRPPESPGISGPVSLGRTASGGVVAEGPVPEFRVGGRKPLEVDEKTRDALGDVF